MNKAKSDPWERAYMNLWEDVRFLKEEWIAATPKTQLQRAIKLASIMAMVRVMEHMETHIPKASAKSKKGKKNEK